MKKALLMAAALLLAPMAATAADYKEGVHYTVINEGPATSKPEITEFFSFFCGHCYNFSKTVVPKIEATLPEGVAFNQAHVEFIGADMGVEMSRAFAIAHQLNVEKKVEPAIFAAIHDKKQRFTNLNDIRMVFIANGVDGKDFDAAAKSFMVNAQMSKMKRDTQNAKISGVPSLVVNGKYRVETGAIKSYDELLDIAYYLATADK
ncbi:MULTISPECIES: thiol:disulfide interchange protein DsbA/DsbL [unclassified Shewanella]|uniref:thiol:disulfide interchange protein DsbA/DsbL n=1 Tax=unclassified Shewanella TaxID=196818 RepID=UPI000C8616D0|nr:MULTISPECIES: thiol:disulfide interchange protein DsbA/DsbL [unclassified Shewanella]MDO6620823.1 thiol:disulfide interchange protein DsbA/DsbL [Shewanella sp. 6_MG-2023]MDO6640160.1 thiol:disulfide interchange protein DsbA/DsbL [Shewanella sp. 5_MG-2023]MDO6680371.1 thiol:disulfide interchange protein DsbA/DsbL [Shewanella sp. 4_MG-2023]MDO6776945.1 thiol:disulfide interchange protein DsbA/DsbL [Shewanella sp. 3_MG-2023]PMG30974.1 disulfide bond formation protein DsbA [Shewanella sp. 10N.2